MIYFRARPNSGESSLRYGRRYFNGHSSRKLPFCIFLIRTRRFIGAIRVRGLIFPELLQATQFEGKLGDRSDHAFARLFPCGFLQGGCGSREGEGAEIGGPALELVGVVADLGVVLIGEDLVEERTSELKIIRGLLPICSSRRKVRDDEGYWSELEHFVCEHSEADFSHGLCPNCARELYPKQMELD